MKLTICDRPGAGHRRKRVGRGPGSGHGKTSTKGSKGQSARSGGGRPRVRGRPDAALPPLPKRGFTPYGGKTSTPS
jgi:large subunit ribosomal protein L15